MFPQTVRNLLLITLFVCLSAPSIRAESGYASVQKDLPYKATSSQNVLDLYYPKAEAGRYPTHIYLHGGGWTGGSKSFGPGRLGQMFQQLGDAGFLGISVEYRKVNAGDNVFMRECVVDCMDALRYLFAHAEELKIDTDNVFVWGGSAGGHLSLLCATVPTGAFAGELPEPEDPIRFKAVLAWYPPTDMPHYEAISVEYNKKLRDLGRRMGRTLEEEPDAFVEISPLDNLTAEDPPSFLIHGDHDDVVNLEHSVRYQAKAEELGVPCELMVIENAGHGFGSRNGKPIVPDDAAILERSVGFIVDHLNSR